MRSGLDGGLELHDPVPQRLWHLLGREAVVEEVELTAHEAVRPIRSRVLDVAIERRVGQRVGELQLCLDSSALVRFRGGHVGVPPRKGGGVVERAEPVDGSRDDDCGIAHAAEGYPRRRRLRSPVVGTDAHRAAAAGKGPVSVGVITVSDSRTPDDDTNGIWLREHVEAAGAVVSGYHLVRDEPDEVRAALEDLVAAAQVVVVNGGTGVSRRDTTYDTLAGMLEKTLPGFGELFRMLSWDQVGSAAMLSRPRRAPIEAQWSSRCRVRPRPSRSPGRS